ncbi:Ff.00g101250.m01.CDS01 [Fusarium sp. VM40]|nr:Ff.00g101250.m01.CDS01 [Fusarium sp. VM40]
MNHAYQNQLVVPQIQSCWNPKDLFNITKGTSAIWCVGRYVSYPGGSCSRNSSPRRSAELANREVEGLLQHMSMTLGTVQNNDLYRLANLCLCTIHSGQSTEVVTKWMHIIESATRHHLNLSRFSDASVRLSLTKLDLDTSIHHNNVLQQELKSWQEKTAALVGSSELERKKAARFSVKAEKQIRDLEIMISSAKQALKKMEVEATNQGLTITGLKSTKTHLEITVNKSAVEIKALYTEKTEAYDKIQLLQTELGGLRQKEEVSAQNLEKLQAEFNNVEYRSRLMAEDLGGKEELLKKQNTDMVHAKRHIEQLELQILQLKDSGDSLRQSIAECWFHRLCDWFSEILVRRSKDLELKGADYSIIKTDGVVEC